MKKHKIGCLVGVVIFAGLIVAMIAGIHYEMTPERQNEEKRESAAASASEAAEIKRNAVLDVTQFAGVKPDDLIKIMGKPSKTYKDKGDDADTYYDYNNSEYWCEFTVVNSKVKKLEINSQKYYSGKGKDFTFYDTEKENLKAFGVVPEYQYTEKYTGLAMNLTDGITDTISAMKFQLIDKDNKTFQVLWVDYF